MENDVTKYSALIGKYVCIETVDIPYEGFVNAIDPVSQSVILSTKRASQSHITLVLGHAIQSMAPKEAPDAECERCDMRTEADEFDPAEAEARKRRVREWLLRNLLPVAETSEGDLDVHDGYLVIRPPYRPDDCFSGNAIILGRVQHLIANIPEGFGDGR